MYNGKYICLISSVTRHITFTIHTVEVLQLLDGGHEVGVLLDDGHQLEATQASHQQCVHRAGPAGARHLHHHPSCANLMNGAFAILLTN